MVVEFVLARGRKGDEMLYKIMKMLGLSHAATMVVVATRLAIILHENLYSQHSSLAETPAPTLLSTDTKKD